jgi:hypothetical protein
MVRYCFISAILALALNAGTGIARDLQVEVDVLHVGGQLPPTELEAILADPKLVVEAHYQPTRLIEDVTARRERTMPLGSRLFAIPQVVNLTGAQIERKGRTLRFQVPDVPPGHDQYRLRSMNLLMPVAPGTGRPQPNADVTLYDEAPAGGAWEAARFGRYGAFDLGLRLRHRWSDAKGEMQVVKLVCHRDIQALGGGQYRFRSRHRHEGLFRSLASDAQSDPPSRPRAGQRSRQMREPFPAPIAGWRVSRNHLVQLDLDGQVVERLSVYAEQAGAGSCRRTYAYDALFSGGQPVVLKRSIHAAECEGKGDSPTVEVTWAGDGSLARYIFSSPQGLRDWDGFEGAACGSGAPPSDEVEALRAELQGIRDAFLR